MRWIRAVGFSVSLALVATAVGGHQERVAAQESPERRAQQVEQWDYATRPDLKPPVIDVTTSTSSTAGHTFLTPRNGGAQPGPLIVDDQGETVWAAPAPSDRIAMDFRVQTYHGQPVLTWWEGKVRQDATGLKLGHGTGEFVMMDSSYHEIARVKAGNGLAADFHEFRLTDEGTALFVAYQAEPVDLTAVGGPQDGYEMESYVQEVDIATGNTLLQWRPGNHVPITDTYSHVDEKLQGVTQDKPFDWFHANSVAVGPDNDTLLVSARNTKAVYAIDRHSGEVRWQMGGKNSDFTIGDGADFGWQHDVEWLPDGQLKIFDNHATSKDDRTESRALILNVDMEAKTATLHTEARHPSRIKAINQGNTQILANGNLFVGWGHVGRATEFDANQNVVFDADFQPAESYRAYRHEWTGHPTAPPDVVAQRGDNDKVDVTFSWNGATNVAHWTVLEGNDTSALKPVVTVAKDGFETTATVDKAAVIQIQAMDAAGNVIGTSAPVTVGG